MEFGFASWSDIRLSIALVSTGLVYGQGRNLMAERTWIAKYVPGNKSSPYLSLHYASIIHVHIDQDCRKKERKEWGVALGRNPRQDTLRKLESARSGPDNGPSWPPGCLPLVYGGLQ